MPDPAPRRSLSDLVGTLREAGIDLDAEELADAFWLSQWLPADLPSTTEAPGRAGSAETGAVPAEQGRSRDGGPPSRRGIGLLPRRAAGLLAATPVAALGDIGVPSGTPLPAPLALQRALRPFQRYLPRIRPARTELDEDATAERSARLGLVLPVLREVPRREAELQLLMDGSTAMAVWEPMLWQLRDIAEQVGAFRKVSVHYLRPTADGEGVGAARNREEPPRSAEELYDPTGRRVSLVVSDCMGALWQGGALQRLLCRWAAHTPVALIQPLPQRLWDRTALPVAAGRLRRRGGSYRAPEFLGPRAPERLGPALPLPVLSPEPAALGAWSRLAGGSGGLTVRCAAAWIGANGGGTPLPRPEPVPDEAEELLHRFERQASPPARQLAMHLSAAALTMPVILLVQRAMLPQTGPTELAEVLISDLLTPRRGNGPQPDGELWFDFAPGVRDLLLSRLTVSEAALVLKHCSLYIERTFGHGARNLPAVAVAYLSDSPREARSGAGAVPEAFARVSESVLRRFEPALAPLDDRARSGQARLDRYRRDGFGRDLLEAVQLLRAAGPRGQLPLAEALAASWLVWHDPAVLDEAEQVAQAALDADDERRDAVTGVLAGVLLERAGLHHAAGDWHAAQADLLRSEELWRIDLAAAEPSSPRLAAAGVGYAEVLRLQYRTEEQLLAGDGESAADRRERLRLLEQAEETLNALLPQWPPPARPPRLALTLGRVLLDRVRAAEPEPDPGAQQELVLRAVALLGSGLGLSFPGAARLEQQDPEPADGSAPVRSPEDGEALLDLAEALLLQDRLLPAGTVAVERAEQVLWRVVDLARERADDALQAEALHRLGRLLLANGSHPVDRDRLLTAEQVLTDALLLVPLDAPKRAELLASRGRVLLELNPAGPGLDEAVKALREAVSATTEQDPELTARRLMFAQALRTRYRTAGRLADLYEAQWSLEQAERGAPEPAIEARAGLELGDVRWELGRRADSGELLEAASLGYLRAADAAQRAGLPLLAARAHHRRGVVLEVVAGPWRAREAYRRAWQQWQAAGATGDPEALLTEQRIRGLEP
ncbi:SAV_2336 N-terminal domain-related protein [Streptacidiphilus sp. EB129]|uniref:SAV_2336 N-terminal domain-related protein n=1 Tax=Streptacidiphilus sp. EB129 TaxID=3156262 RepID=UPI00351515BA